MREALRNPVVLIALWVTFGLGTCIGGELDSIWDLQEPGPDGNGIHPKADADPFPENLVVVEGLALNASAELLDPDEQWQLYVAGIGDDRGGIAAWHGIWFVAEWPPPFPDVQPGDLVRLTGYVSNHRGKVNMNTRHSDDPDQQFQVEIIGQVGMPRPLRIPGIASCVVFDRTRETGGERYQAQWCTIKNVSVASGEWTPANDDLMITDDSGAQLNLYLSGMGDFAGITAPEGKFNVTGIFDQEDPDEPFTGNYRLWIKSMADIEQWSQADVDDDGCVNVMDLLSVRGNLGKPGSAINPLGADVDGDGKVNVMDLLSVRSALGRGRSCSQ